MATYAGSSCKKGLTQINGLWFSKANPYALLTRSLRGAYADFRHQKPQTDSSIDVQPACQKHTLHVSMVYARCPYTVRICVDVT